MEIKFILAKINKIIDYIITPGTLPEEIHIGIIIAIVVGIISFFISHFYVARLVRNEQMIKSALIKQAIDYKLFAWLNYLIPVLAVQFLFSFYELNNKTVGLAMVTRLLDSLVFLLVFILLLKIIAFLKKFYAHSKLVYGRTLSAYLQLIHIAVFLAGSIVGICLILDESPWKILSGLGAVAAVILFVFKDTILSTIANIQIEFHDLIRVGDTIEVRDYDADGTIVDIKFHTVKVQNWDQSTVYIPVYKFVEGSYKNWRSIKDGSARRIRHTFLIDPRSLRFCNEKLIKSLQRIDFMQDFLAQNELNTAPELITNKTWTNLGLFRVYLNTYLMNNLKIRQDMPCRVRQLAPTKDGVLPFDIYVFTSEIEWAKYENIQAEILDHIVAALHIFGLQTVVLKNRR